MVESVLGNRIRDCRDREGLSLTELAARARVSKAYLSQLETGSSRQPSYEILRRLSTGLGVSINELVGESATWEPSELDEIPSSLRAFAERSELPETDLRMLAGIHFRGRQPKDPEDWSHLYETIKRTIR